MLQISIIANFIIQCLNGQYLTVVITAVYISHPFSPETHKSIKQFCTEAIKPFLPLLLRQTFYLGKILMVTLRFHHSSQFMIESHLNFSHRFMNRL